MSGIQALPKRALVDRVVGSDSAHFQFLWASRACSVSSAEKWLSPAIAIPRRHDLPCLD